MSTAGGFCELAGSGKEAALASGGRRGSERREAT
jgi:hypothetical protein